MHPLFHAHSSARKWGGSPDDYLRIHEWFDASKAMMADLRHRALRHHAEGIFLCEQIFGAALVNSDGRVIPVRWIPSMQDWFKHIRPEKWMRRAGALEEQPAAEASAASTS
ncbi:MAG TPA: hypothetical protein VL096_12980 [Pirellulaceae bacterium]|nr:hypothetical protein [Pirellulaceae bacterium]